MLDPTSYWFGVAFTLSIWAPLLAFMLVYGDPKPTETLSDEQKWRKLLEKEQKY